jgi:hypothetical protein
MTDSKDYSFPSVPTRTQLTAARAALAAQQKAGNYLCGCFSALCRDPFFPSLVSHWQMYHLNSLAILGNAQAHRPDLDPRPEAAEERGRAHYRFSCSTTWREANLEQALEMEAKYNKGERGDLP